MLDLYERETEESLARVQATNVPEVGMFDGFVRGAGMGAVRTAIKTVARPVAMVGSIGAGIYDLDQSMVPDAISSGTSARDRYFRTMDEIFDSAIDYWTPKANEVGVAGEVVGQLLGLLPIVVASPATAVAGTYLDTATELSKKGVGDWRAQAVGAAQAAGLGAGIWMPIMGSTLAQRVLVGGASFNVVQGVVTRGAGETILGDHPAAAEFKALDGTAMTLDVLLGMAFGGITHLSPAQRAQGAAAWKRIGEWAKELPPTDKSAIMVLREGQHLNLDSLPGKPVSALDQDAHVQRMRTVLDQVIRGEPVHVEGMPAPKMEPDQARWAEADKRARALAEEGEALAKEEGFAETAANDPSINPEQTEPEGPPAQRAESASTPPPEAGTKAKPGGPEAVDPLAREVDAFVQQYESLPMRVGQEANGEPVVKTVKEFIEDARANSEQARQDANLFEVAAACMLGVT